MLADTEEVALTFEQSTIGSGNAVQTTRIRHPIALFFHLFFKSLAIFLYFFSSLFYSNFITIFVILIIFLSMDFWTVKNITGRLLVGLRWWNHIDESGQSKWIFENRKVFLSVFYINIKLDLKNCVYRRTRIICQFLSLPPKPQYSGWR